MFTIISCYVVAIYTDFNEEYKVDPTLLNSYVLVNAFSDGSRIVPVKLEVKEFNDKENSLHVAITLEPIENDDIFRRGNTASSVTQSPISSFKITIPQLLNLINEADEDFVKYIPIRNLQKSRFSIVS